MRQGGSSEVFAKKAIFHVCFTHFFPMHNHSCGNEGHQCSHHTLQGTSPSLLSQIDLENVIGYNLVDPTKTRHIFKGSTNPEHLSNIYIESDADEEILLYIPFTSNVRIVSISIVGTYSDNDPSEMKAYSNRHNLTFDDIGGAKYEQSWSLADLRQPHQQGLPEYATIVSRFSACKNLNLYFPKNFGSETTKISYINIMGDYVKINKDPIITLYELAPNPADHKLANKSLSTNRNLV